MQLTHSTITIAGLALLANMALALPQDLASTAVSQTDTAGPSSKNPSDTGAGGGWPPITITTTTVTTVSGTATTAPPITSTGTSTNTSTSSFNTRLCDYRYCDNGRDICFYWAGYTSWDVSRGPQPGEIPTILGTCTGGI
ncbi:hypothetical protein GGR54DRAFT_469129 [Hypoxylon sp. NC1633]|nr:hypothetical protein GGR54DRAFT_469129 [Hypoxylon sp. NC1633]